MRNWSQSTPFKTRNLCIGNGSAGRLVIYLRDYFGESSGGRLHIAISKLSNDDIIPRIYSFRDHVARSPLIHKTSPSDPSRLPCGAPIRAGSELDPLRQHRWSLFVLGKTSASRLENHSNIDLLRHLRIKLGQYIFAAILLGNMVYRLCLCVCEDDLTLRSGQIDVERPT